jgi:hypothetical protein
MKLQSQSEDGQGEIALSSTLAGSGTPFDLYRDLVEHSQDLLCTHDLSGRYSSSILFLRRFWVMKSESCYERQCGT